MTDLYSTPRDRRPVPSLQVAASAGIAEAERTVVLALRLDAPETVLDTALRMARFEGAALRVVVGLTLIGPGTLVDLAWALFIGIAVGTVSSIFIATPVFTQLRENEPAMKEHTARVLRRRERAAHKDPQVTAQTVAAEGPGDVTSITGSERHQPRRSTRSERKK